MRVYPLCPSDGKVHAYKLILVIPLLMHRSSATASVCTASGRGDPRMRRDVIPVLRRSCVPQQSGTDALVTTLSALLDRAVMQTVTFVVENRIPLQVQ